MSTGTQVEVVMPQMGVSVSEGTITRWLKQLGEEIALDEPLLEISTDKVDTEVPSPGEGVVAEIRVQEGETVEVGTVLAVIAPAGAVAEPAAPEAAPPAAAEEAPAVEAPVAAAETPSAPAEEAAAPAAPPSAAPEPDPVAAGNGRTFISPVVARIAAEHNVDPGAIAGTGQGGRVTKKDILAYIESGAAAAPPAPAEAPAPAPEAVAPVPAAPTPEAPSAPATPPSPAAPAPATAPAAAAHRPRPHPSRRRRSPSPRASASRKSR